MITIDDIRAKEPCNDPTNWIPEAWSGTLLDLYNLENLDDVNKVLVGVWFLSEDELSSFSAWCVDQVAGDTLAVNYAACRPIRAAAWMTARRAAQVGLSRADQVAFLKDLETNRG